MESILLVTPDQTPLPPNSRAKYNYCLLTIFSSLLLLQSLLLVPIDTCVPTSMHHWTEGINEDGISQSLQRGTDSDLEEFTAIRQRAFSEDVRVSQKEEI
jgi:hypothetical protein